MTQQTANTFYLKYDSEWEVWALWQHTPGEIDHLLAEFCDGTPEGSQLATLVLDLLTVGSTIADEVETQQIVSQASINISPQSNATQVNKGETDKR